MSFDFFSDSSVDYEGESEVEAYYDEYYGEGYYSEHMEHIITRIRVEMKTPTIM